jgi:hypothetical protein
LLGFDDSRSRRQAGGGGGRRNAHKYITFISAKESEFNADEKNPTIQKLPNRIPIAWPRVCTPKKKASKTARTGSGEQRIRILRPLLAVMQS